MAKSNPSDIRAQPAYTLAEAARYLKVAPATLRAWFLGRDYPKGSSTVHSKPLIRPAGTPPPTLSFWNLIEAHVLRSLRTDHGVKMDALVVGDGDPAFLANLPQPFLVRAIRCEMISVTFDGQSGLLKNGGKFLAEVPVGEEDRGVDHAARS